MSGPILKKWTTASARRATATRIARIEAQLVEIASLWGDVDEYLVRRAEEVRDLVRDFEAEVMSAEADEAAVAWEVSP